MLVILRGIFVNELQNLPVWGCLRSGGVLQSVGAVPG